jgi:hypothetical protein
MKKAIIILLAVALIGIFFVGCSSSSSSPSKTNVSFEEEGYFRKPLPNGSGDARVQAVYVKGFQDTPEVWQAIEKYGKQLAWFKGDVNVIFFFDDKDHTPSDEITLAKDYNTALSFPSKYNDYCVAEYWHYANGQEKFIKYPFKQ